MLVSQCAAWACQGGSTIQRGLPKEKGCLQMKNRKKILAILALVIALPGMMCGYVRQERPIGFSNGVTTQVIAVSEEGPAQGVYGTLLFVSFIVTMWGVLLAPLVTLRSRKDANAEKAAIPESQMPRA